MSVYIKSYTDKNGKLKKVYENLRFIDSYKFMLSPHSKLVKYLPEEKFFLLENYFEELGYSSEQIALLKQKGTRIHTSVVLKSFEKPDCHLEKCEATLYRDGK